jgi:hypothetical protein
MGYNTGYYIMRFLELVAHMKHRQATPVKQHVKISNIKLLVHPGWVGVKEMDA